AVIGGLITSTLLSLVVVPVVFTYVYRVQAWLKQIIAPKPLPPVHPLPTGHAPDARPLWAEERSPIRQRSVR
ncbi:MAG TPA: hypothetical protein VL379_18860, partial [Pseudomonadales bacterium]|nr:hypothetical protein [Pseudomonadales bacterium]